MWQLACRSCQSSTTADGAVHAQPGQLARPMDFAADKTRPNAPSVHVCPQRERKNLFPASNTENSIYHLDALIRLTFQAKSREHQWGLITPCNVCWS